MATTPTTRVTALARDHRIDVDTATYPAVGYEQIYGVEDAKLIEDLRVEEDETHSDDGAMRETNVGYSWRLELRLAFSTDLAQSAVDTVHAFLRTRFKMHRSVRVEATEFGLRFYQRDGLDDGHCHEGRCYVKSWSMPGGQGGDRIDVVLQGQGGLADIANPAGSLVPTVTSISPTSGSTAGKDQTVDIYGQHYKPNGVSTVTAVDFGAVTAVDYTVVSDSRIVAIPPAGLAGTVQVKVTTTAGASANTAADDYTYA